MPWAEFDRGRRRGGNHFGTPSDAAWVISHSDGDFQGRPSSAILLNHPFEVQNALEGDNCSRNGDGRAGGTVPDRGSCEMTNIGTLFAFAVVCGAVLILRRTNPGAPRPFRVPFVPLVPILGVGACCSCSRSPLTTGIRCSAGWLSAWSSTSPMVAAIVLWRQAAYGGPKA